MSIYILLLLLLILGIFIEQTKKFNKLNTFIYKFNLLLLFLLAALRYKISTDYYLYYKVYEKIKLLNSIKGIKMEKGYLYLNYLFINLNFQMLIFVLHMILFIFLYNILKKERYKNVGLFIYFTNYYLVNNFNVIRQGIAEVIFLFSLRYIVQRNFFKYTFLNLIGLSFQRISLLAFLCFNMILKKRKNVVYILLVVFCIFISIVQIDGKIIMFLNEKFNKIELFRRVYYYYFIKSKGIFGGNSMIGYTYRIILFIQALYVLKKSNNKYEIVISNLIIYSICIYFLFSNVGVLAGRISKFYQCVLIILNMKILEKIQNSKIRLLILMIIMSYSVIFFVKELEEKHPVTNEKLYYPYRNIFMNGEPKKWEKLHI